MGAHWHHSRPFFLFTSSPSDKLIHQSKTTPMSVFHLKWFKHASPLLPPPPIFFHFAKHIFYRQFPARMQIACCSWLTGAWSYIIVPHIKESIIMCWNSFKSHWSGFQQKAAFYDYYHMVCGLHKRPSWPHWILIKIMDDLLCKLQTPRTLQIKLSSLETVHSTLHFIHTLAAM